ncbi:MAG: molybdopterin molybdotransferase MoeA [Methanothrix sp.]|nr:molybdopterin molybdotransferase MoeA [Methanothrix sp.]
MFRHLMGASEARGLLLDRCQPIDRVEMISAAGSAGRVLSRDLVSPVDLPGFPRAAMDGFAVRSQETQGATLTSPVYIERFVPVRTGAPVPGGFDAVLMLEDARLRGTTIEATGAVRPYQNISPIGEDLRRGEVVMGEGHRLRPPDIALMASLGIREVEVYARPRVQILPTGGELVPRWERPLLPGEAYETNPLMAGLYVEMWGGQAVYSAILPDDPSEILEAMSSCRDADMAVVIGGTSVGERDYAPSVLAEAGELLVHGVRVQPGKPTAIGTVGGRPVICLPGYPVAALSDLLLFVRPALKQMAHLSDPLPVVRATLAGKVASRPGYMSFVRVALRGGMAEPIMTSGAGILSSVARADGFLLVPEEREGIEEGEIVDVYLFE